MRRRIPTRPAHLVLRGVFTMTQAELDWFYGGRRGGVLARDLGAVRTALIPEDERGDMIAAYHKRLFSGDIAQEITHAKAWSAWENALATVQSTGTGGDAPADYARAFARLENHYFRNLGFLEKDGHILDHMDRIARCPAPSCRGAMT